jgi:hypothetical protein
MARTIDEIKSELQIQWMQSDVAESLYGLTRDGDVTYDEEHRVVTFDSYFSKVAVERLIIYIIAFCVNFLERLLDTATADLTALVEKNAPGRCDWYARKLKEYQDGDLPNEAGEYDVIDESKRIVKHAVAIDDTKASKMLILKVAGDDGQGGRMPLTADEAARLAEYVDKIKYAGVPTELRNAEGDTFSCNAKIWYDPIISGETVEDGCKAAIKSYVENLPFNGEYSDMALVDALQVVPGVKIVGSVMTRSQRQGETETPAIQDKTRPYAGYFKCGAINLTMKPYNAYNMDSDE